MISNRGVYLYIVYFFTNESNNLGGSMMAEKKAKAETQAVETVADPVGAMIDKLVENAQKADRKSVV